MYVVTSTDPALDVALDELVALYMFSTWAECNARTGRSVGVALEMQVQRKSDSSGRTLACPAQLMLPFGSCSATSSQQTL